MCVFFEDGNRPSEGRALLPRLRLSESSQCQPAAVYLRFFGGAKLVRGSNRGVGDVFFVLKCCFFVFQLLNCVYLSFFGFCLEFHICTFIILIIINCNNRYYMFEFFEFPTKFIHYTLFILSCFLLSIEIIYYIYEMFFLFCWF